MHLETYLSLRVFRNIWVTSQLISKSKWPNENYTTPGWAFLLENIASESTNKKLQKYWFFHLPGFWYDRMKLIGSRQLKLDGTCLFKFGNVIQIDFYLMWQSWSTFFSYKQPDFSVKPLVVRVIHNFNP